jgi:IS5 family transposase
MSETMIQFPVTCPECGRETLLTRPLDTVVDTLVAGRKTLPLYAPCHARHWTANERELQQIREYLGAWFTAATAQIGADGTRRRS